LLEISTSICKLLWISTSICKLHIARLCAHMTLCWLTNVIITVSWTCYAY
jgi:hypothetical protein